MEEEAAKLVTANFSADKFNELPQVLQSHTLLNLRTKDVVGFSQVYSKWRNMWKSVPGLVVGYGDFPHFSEFVSFVDRFLALNRNVSLSTFKLKSQMLHRKNAFDWEDQDVSHVTRWVISALSNNVQHLCIQEDDFEDIVEMPSTVYISRRLLSLKLRHASLPYTETVSLPSLKILKLEYAIFPCDSVFELLISQSPLLERLTVNRTHEDNLKGIYVHSKSLLSLWFVGMQEFDIDEAVTLWIDAPKLHYLSIVRDATNWFKTEGFGALVKLDLDTNFNMTFSDLKSDNVSKRVNIWRFMNSLSNVTDLTLTLCTVEAFDKIGIVKAKDGEMRLIAFLLEICSTLKKLKIVLGDNEGGVILEKLEKLRQEIAVSNGCILSVV